MGVLTLGPEGSPRMRFERHFAFWGNCLNRLDLAANVFNLVRAIVDVIEVQTADEMNKERCSSWNQNKTFNYVQDKTILCTSVCIHKIGPPLLCKRSVKSQYL